MKELLESVLKYLPDYLLGIVSLVTGPKTAILQWVDEEKGGLARPFIFVALSVTFGFLLQLPQVGKDQDYVTLVAGVAVFKVIALVLFSVLIHLLFRAVRGHASFTETFSAYLYIVSPLYIVLVILHIATLGVLYAYNPVVATAASLDPNYFYADVVRWRTFENAAPEFTIAYILMHYTSPPIVLIVWFVACWGAFRRLHGVSFWLSALVGIATLVAGVIFVLSMNYIMLGMFGTRVPALQ